MVRYEGQASLGEGAEEAGLDLSTAESIEEVAGLSDRSSGNDQRRVQALTAQERTALTSKDRLLVTGQQVQLLRRGEMTDAHAAPQHAGPSGDS